MNKVVSCLLVFVSTSGVKSNSIYFYRLCLIDNHTIIPYLLFLLKNLNKIQGLIKLFKCAIMYLSQHARHQSDGLCLAFPL